MRAKGLTAAALVTALCVAAVARPSNRAFPGRPGKIAFVALRYGGYNPDEGRLATVQPNGRGQRLLGAPAEGEIVGGPAWSPDGTRLAYHALTASGQLAVFLAGADGASPRRLDRVGFDEVEPAWSPDGARLAFEGLPGGPTAIFVENVDGTGLQELPNGGQDDDFPAWSPDGTRIAFSSHAEDQQDDVWVMNADGGARTRLTTAGGADFEPSWSPDGSQLAFVSDRLGSNDIWVMNADGSNARPLTTDPSDDEDPAWSPDGKKIVFTSRRNRHDWELYVTNAADGSAVTRLTHSPKTRDMEPDWQSIPQ